jgi:membrane protein DedA with SNARE-associated domain
LLVQQYGQWIYAILFVIIFSETGFVVTPFLPGDSLLFVAGALAALGGMQIGFLLAVLIAAALLGNMLNYQIGRLSRAKGLPLGTIAFFQPISARKNARLLREARAARPWSFRVSCRCSAPLHRSWRASAR